MMQTLIIYDDEGFIYAQITGYYRVPKGGIQYLEINSSMYVDKIIKSVNMKTKELIVEDIPKSDKEIDYENTVEELQDSIIDLTYENLILKIGEDNV